MGQSAAQEARTARRLREALAPIGLVEADRETLAGAWALAAELIGPQIASQRTLRALHARTGYGVYVARDEDRVVGFVALLLLNRTGLAAIRREAFDPANPDLGHIAGAGEEPAGVYGWGVAGVTRRAAMTAALGSKAAVEAISQPYFARAATDAGLRMLIRIGFVPYPGSASGLLWRDPQAHARSAA